MKILDRIEEGFCGIALFATVVILFINIVLRYLFKSGTSWSEELIKYLMIWTTFIGASICVRKGDHVSIDLFVGCISQRARKAAELAVYFVSLLFTAAMAYYGVRTVLFTINTAQVSPALQIPMWIPYLAIPLGFMLMSLRLIQRITQLIKDTHYKAEGERS